MNKIELKRRLEEIEELLTLGKYSAVVKKCDALNLEQLTNPRLLQEIAKAYEKCRRYVDAEDVLLHARSFAPKSRSLLFHLCNVATKAGDIEEAKEFYQDFARVAPEDSERFVLQYRIGVALDQPPKVLIQILEYMKEEDADDHWMFVLAQLYAKDGQREKAVAVCDEIALWFHDGKYVKQAAELKEQLVDYMENPVTYAPAELKKAVKREQPEESAEDTAEETPESAEPEEEIPEIRETPESAEPEDAETLAEPEITWTRPLQWNSDEALLPRGAKLPKEEKKETDAASAFDDTIPDMAPVIPEAEEETEPAEAPEDPESLPPEDSGETPESYAEEASEEPEESAEGLPEVISVELPENRSAEERLSKRPVIDNSNIAGHFRALFGEEDEPVTTIQAGSGAEAAPSGREHTVVTVSSAESLVGSLKAEKISRTELPERPSEKLEEDSYENGRHGKEPLPRVEYDSEKVEKPDYILDEGSSAILEKIAKKRDAEQLFGNLPVNPEISNRIWHFIVFGETSELALECALEKWNLLNRTVHSCPKKVLKISAKKIANASIVNSMDHFLGNTVIVENAGNLSDTQLTDFAKILDRDDRSLLIIFTGSKRQITELLKRVPALVDSFTAVFEGRNYQPKDLVRTVSDYLFSQDAKMTSQAEMYVLGLARRCLLEKQGSYVRQMESLAAAALEKAEKGGFLGLGSGKTDRENFLILDERHFRKAVKEKAEAAKNRAPEKEERGE